jgi:hypothetical protein
MARGSRRRSSLSSKRLRRRDFLVGSLAFAPWALLPLRPAWGRPADGVLPAATVEALEKSDYVYVSPLRGNGSESRCHGEVWYGWLDGAVVLNTQSGTWKAQALRRGLTGARIWVGNYGRWKGMLGANEKFRAGPHFDARASRITDRAISERLLAIFDQKYPGDIERWREQMRSGFDSGDRIVIRYEPVADKS